MSRWYRAYEGTVTDPKFGEVALVAECSKSLVIAAWHSILESCASCNDAGRFDVTPRRVAVILGEHVKTIEAVFAEMASLGLIEGNVVCAWARRQFESDNSTERSKKFREAKRNAEKTPVQQECNDDATLQQRSATPPYTDTDTDTDTDKIRLEANPIVCTKLNLLSETSSDETQNVFENSEAKPEKPETARKERRAYSAAFEKFWSEYPTDPNMSKKQAARAWTRISEEDRSKAIAAIKHYRDWMARQSDYRTLHAERFISQRRFDGFLEKAAGDPSKSNLGTIGFYVAPDSDEMSAWDEFWLSTKGKHMPRDKNGGWFCMTQFPPIIERLAS